jgi:hypothetical protein
MRCHSIERDAWFPVSFAASPSLRIFASPAGLPRATDAVQGGRGEAFHSDHHATTLPFNGGGLVAGARNFVTPRCVTKYAKKPLF